MTGLILLAHGARDPQWAVPFGRLRERVTAKAPGVDVSLAFLERMHPTAAEAAAQLVMAGCASLVIVPVFFGQGEHVRVELPGIVASLQRAHPMTNISCAGPVGDDLDVIDAVAGYCVLQLALGDPGPG